jgi:shikimate kinase
VAAGGGAFAQDETRGALSQGAFTVFLRCDLETVLRRVRLDGSRPLAVSRERIGLLFAERQPSYRLAELEVDATAPPEAVAREIVRAFRGEGAAQLRTKG